MWILNGMVTTHTDGSWKSRGFTELSAQAVFIGDTDAKTGGKARIARGTAIQCNCRIDILSAGSRLHDLQQTISAADKFVHRPSRLP